SLGFASNRSICDGPPDWKRKITRRARGGKWRAVSAPLGAAASGDSAATVPGAVRNGSRAAVPRPDVVDRRNSRRVVGALTREIMGRLFSSDGLIKIHDNVSQHGPSGVLDDIKLVRSRPITDGDEFLGIRTMTLEMLLGLPIRFLEQTLLLAGRRA